jgi:F-type H+-transporting ATPase subunit epsilon
MHLEILTPDQTVFSGRIKSITVPGTKGPFTVLQNHAPIISTLETGEMSFLTDAGHDQFYLISEGMIEVNKNRIMVLIEKIRTID